MDAKQRAAAVRAWLVTPGHGDLPRLRTDLERALELGVPGIQLREPCLAPRDLIDLARQLRAQRPETALLVSDRVDVASHPVFDGVQLGFRALAPAAARRLLGPEKWIRRSTHGLDEVSGGAASALDDLDAVTFGPVFDTPSKRGRLAPRGLESLRAVVAASPWPVTAIGGIVARHAAEVLATGVHAIAAIGAFRDEASARALLAAVRVGEPR